MKKEFIALFLIGIFGFFGMIRSNSPVVSGSDLEFHVNVVNDLTHDIDDVKTRVLIYDIGEVITTNTFDVEDMSSYGKFILWNTDDFPEGDYLVRITISNDDFREVKHRYISII